MRVFNQFTNCNKLYDGKNTKTKQLYSLNLDRVNRYDSNGRWAKRHSQK